jgi:hypothetical protein
MATTKNHKVPAVHFMGTLLANLDNEKLSDADFRDFIRNTMPIVEKPSLDSGHNDSIKNRIKKYYNEE